MSIQNHLEKISKFLPFAAAIFLLGVIIVKSLARPVEKGSEHIIVGEVKGASDVESEQKCSVYIDVGGAVAKPGVYCLKEGERLVVAVQKAGGFLKSSYASKYVSRYLNLALPVKEDQKLYIPYQNDLSCSVIPFELRAQEEKEVLDKINSGEKKEDLEKEEEESASCVSINTAGKDKLMTISGVGESMSQKIIDGRPYKVLEDLKGVSGVGETTFEKWRPYICL